MRVLVIDSHKSSNNGPQQNLHWLNAKFIADLFPSSKLIWSYPSVNDDIQPGFDKIVFVHASPYAFTDYAWIEASPDADLFYVTNEYNLGEPRTLWMAAKAGRKYTVIANHEARVSKVVQKYVLDWRIVNLNALSFMDKPKPQHPFACGSVYYGSFRKDRAAYFARYLHAPITLSTHKSNVEKFRAAGATAGVAPRLEWGGDGFGLNYFESSLYIEDKTTHTSYNHLPNRFYEALNYSCGLLVDENCANTFALAKYPLDDKNVVTCAADVAGADPSPHKDWRVLAAGEKRAAVSEIRDIVEGFL